MTSNTDNTDTDNTGDTVAVFDPACLSHNCLAAMGSALALEACLAHAKGDTAHADKCKAMAHVFCQMADRKAPGSGIGSAALAHAAKVAGKLAPSGPADVSRN